MFPANGLIKPFPLKEATYCLLSNINLEIPGHEESLYKLKVKSPEFWKDFLNIQRAV